MVISFITIIFIYFFSPSPGEYWDRIQAQKRKLNQAFFLPKHHRTDRWIFLSLLCLKWNILLHPFRRNDLAHGEDKRIYKWRLCIILKRHHGIFFSYWRKLWNNSQWLKFQSVSSWLKMQSLPLQQCHWIVLTLIVLRSKYLIKHHQRMSSQFIRL